MKPFKTWFLFFICLLIGAILLSACQERKRKFLVGVSQCSTDEWRDKMNMEMQNEAELTEKIELIILSSNDNTEKQIHDIRYLISQKVDLLILTPNEIEPITPVIEEIYNKGIPVILVDRKIQSDKYTAFIGADNFQIGKEVGHYVVSLLKEKGRVAEIKGLSGSSPAIERHEGFLEIIKNYPEIEIAFTGDAGWLKDEGAIQMREALKSGYPIDLVFAHNDRMAKGAFQEAESTGLSDSIYFLGIDALPGPGEGIDMVIQNKLAATFLYPTGGDKTIQLATKILTGGSFQKENILVTTVIDESNVTILKLQTDQIIEQQYKIGLLNQRIHKQLEKFILQRNIMYTISLFAFLFCALLIGLFKAYQAKNKLNTQLKASNLEISKQKSELEAKQLQLLSLSKQLEEATHAKIAFFTDISHDFRTPLTLIAGPIDILLEQSDPRSNTHQWLLIIRKNIAVLLRLVNQILEFRQAETNSIQLKLSDNNLDSQICDWNISFSQIAQKNKITFCYAKQEDSNFIFSFDPEKIERVYFNLLANAFKFTSPGGSIDVALKKRIEKDRAWVEIQVSNTGNGLSEQEIKNIFERFYRVESHVAGSGIGLALVKALVELHQGNIHAVSSNNQTTFTVRIPFTSSHHTPDSSEKKSNDALIYADLDNDALIYADLDVDYKILIDGTSEPDLPQTILVIDDNEEIRFYIRSILQKSYRIMEASDGEEGLQLAYENQLDIIISDIMMPKMDGIELCKRIKEDLRVCHIPLILLTACSIDEQRLQGFESGADAYISKPFNPHLLEVRIRKMLENRQMIRKQLRENLFLGSPEVVKINTLDEELILKFKNYILEHISDTDLSVEAISNEFHLSRAQFYRKIKAITNQGPNEFIRSVRLIQSVDILKKGKTVSEAAYETGFTSPSYFAKCFKEYFRKNPSQVFAEKNDG